MQETSLRFKKQKLHESHTRLYALLKQDLEREKKIFNIQPRLWDNDKRLIYYLH